MVGLQSLFRVFQEKPGFQAGRIRYRILSHWYSRRNRNTASEAASGGLKQTGGFTVCPPPSLPQSRRILSGKTLSGQSENKAGVGVVTVRISASDGSRVEFDLQTPRRHRATIPARHPRPFASTGAPFGHHGVRENLSGLFQNLSFALLILPTR